MRGGRRGKAQDAPFGLLVAKPTGADRNGLTSVAALAKAQGGIEIVQSDANSMAWAFADSAAAVGAGVEMARAGLLNEVRVAVHAADRATLHLSERIWPVAENAREADGNDGRRAGGVRNRPQPATSFIGREAEISSCLQAVSEAQLVTLTGAGGCGKTRLALEVAGASAAAFRDGAWWVDLAPIAEAGSLPVLVAHSLDLWLHDEADPAAALAGHLRNRELLLVLDNCEHLIDSCRSLVTAITAGCPGIRILATSRERLGLTSEMTRRVPSLCVPNDRDLMASSEAGRLFAERARAVRPNFAVTAENAHDVLTICRRLDGIPLAIELAAARIRLLSPAEIAIGLEEGFRLLGTVETPLPRHSTLDASMAWSFGLCSTLEQVLFRRLAAFSGGFTLEAVEAVCADAPLDHYAVLDLFDRLIDRSLVAVDDSGADRRYRLLETVRVFADELLAESGDGEAVRDRHLGYFRGRAETAGADIVRTDGLRWLPRLAADYANLVLALEGADAAGDRESLLRMAGSLGLFWEMTGRFADGARWLDRALQRGHEAGGVPAELQLRTLWARAHLAIYAGDFATALAVASGAIAGADQTDDRVTAGRLRNIVGLINGYADPAAAQELLRASISLAVGAADEWGIADGTKFVTVGRMIAGDAPGCDVAAAELRQVGLRLSNAFYVGHSDSCEGYSQLLRGRLREALQSFDRCFAVYADVGDPITGAITVGWRAFALAKLGRYDDCRAEAIQCLERLVPKGGRLGAPWARIALGVADLFEGDFQNAAASLGGVALSSRASGDTISALWAFPLWGQALIQTGRLEEAQAAISAGLELAGPPVGNRSIRAQLLYCQGLLGEARGNRGEAEQLLHQALAIQHSDGYSADAVDTLACLARLAAGAESYQEAARLFGAAEALGAAIGLVPGQAQRLAREAAEGRCRGALGLAFAAALAEGSALSLDDAVAYASRARGARGRPIHGWESLTPTELRVVECVAEGLSNPQIGQRLFMSRPTVKTHLSHVFAKLDVRSRAELAAAAARRAAGPVTMMPARR